MSWRSEPWVPKTSARRNKRRNGVDEEAEGVEKTAGILVQASARIEKQWEIAVFSLFY